MSKIEVKFNNEIYQVEEKTTVLDFVETYYKEDKYSYVLATKDSKLCELHSVIDKACSLELIGKNTVIGSETYRRSLTLLMVAAFAKVLGKDSKYRVNVMYSMGKGYFCKLISDEITLTSELIAKVKACMLDMVASNIVINKESLSTDEAISRFRAQGWQIRRSCSDLEEYLRLICITLTDMRTISMGIWFRPQDILTALIYLHMMMVLYLWRLARRNLTRYRNLFHRRNYLLY